LVLNCGSSDITLAAGGAFGGTCGYGAENVSSLWNRRKRMLNVCFHKFPVVVESKGDASNSLILPFLWLQSIEIAQYLVYYFIDILNILDYHYLT